jgi:hypothetical protein
MREIRNTVVRGDLYVFQTPRGIKVGRSQHVKRRTREVSYEYFNGAKLQLIAEYEGMGYLEPFVHIILNAFRVHERREEFTCDLQTFMMAFDHVKVYDIFGRLKELPPDPRMAARQVVNGVGDPARPAASTGANGNGGPDRGRDAARSRSRTGSRSSSPSSSSHAGSEGEESA